MTAAAAQPGMADEPLDLRGFKRYFDLSMPAICREIFAAHRDSIQVRNEKIAVANLGRIIDATLRIANRKGFAVMSLRELAARSGLSLGGLYAYINSKDDLVAMIQAQGQRQMERVMGLRLAGVDDPRARLSIAIQTHLCLSEVLLPWSQFLYMEARHLAPAQRRQGVAMEQATEKLFADIITDGVRAGVFRQVEPLVAAGMLKALLQDWYLKRRKHDQRGLTVTDYAARIEQLMHYYLNRESTKEPA